MLYAPAARMTSRVTRTLLRSGAGNPRRRRADRPVEALALHELDADRLQLAVGPGVVGEEDAGREAVRLDGEREALLDGVEQEIARTAALAAADRHRNGSSPP